MDLFRKAKLIDIGINAGAGNHRTRTNKEEIKLAIGWLHKDIRTTQLRQVLGLKSSNKASEWIAHTLKMGIDQHLITIQAK